VAKHRKTQVDVALTPASFVADVDAGGERKQTALVALQLLIDRAEAGDEAALSEAIQIHDAMPRLWTATNDLRKSAERLIFKAIPGAENQLYAWARVSRQLDALRADLGGPEPNPLESILVDRLVLCWLHSYQTDLGLAQQTIDQFPLAQRQFAAQQAERAERRFLRAAKTLATVRRLIGPVVQVNLAEEIKQVNLIR
jgi:hypothetical protein